MNHSILFEVNSETDEYALVKLYNAVSKRINTLKALRTIPKAEVVNPTVKVEVNDEHNKS